MSGIYPPNGYRSARVVTVSDTAFFNESQAVAVICTVAGNVAVKMNGTTVTIPVAVGLTILPLSITQLLSTGTTTTATYALLN